MKSVVVIGLLLTVSGPAWAQVYKCTDGSGRTTYTSQPCDSDAKPQSLPGISITPATAATREREEADAEASSQRWEEVEEAEAKVREIQQENADPEKCRAAEQGLARLEARGGDMRGQDAFHYRSFMHLYCNP